MRVEALIGIQRDQSNALGEGGGIQVVGVVLIHRRADLKMREAAL